MAYSTFSGLDCAEIPFVCIEYDRTFLVLGVTGSNDAQRTEKCKDDFFH